MSGAYILILVYSGLAIDYQPREDLAKCLSEAHSRIGENMKVTAWDNMNGSNPVPKLVLAFCTQGAVEQ